MHSKFILLVDFSETNKERKYYSLSIYSIYNIAQSKLGAKIQTPAVTPKPIDIRLLSNSVEW